MRKLRISVLIALLAIVGASCVDSGGPESDDAGDAEEMSLTIDRAPDEVEGNSVRLPVTVTGVEIVAPDGDTSGDSGHFHVFIDRDPAEVGETIPRERDVVHSAENPIKLYGLEVGEHELTVVVGDGTHKRIHGDLEDSVTIDVAGPSVRATAPSTLDEGDDLVVNLESEGVDIVPADSKRNDETGHFHLIVDPKMPPEAGQVVPPAVENQIIHTAESSATIADLKKGEHTIWVVVGDGQHYAKDPAVMDKLTVTVS